ncbi:rab9 effector protein with kelch motifs isoform X5 [Scyliorhinus canicula]|uniref:rab9 effector protein with kelch motifs isoform X5 n=1 Tax=Scyliorhinus canicula TaxID=7830 RepID=UPI0018F71E4B|nr:rab9 effector protein with kelch motifs isoform X5 [Scyliorhinus canicula]
MNYTLGSIKISQKVMELLTALEPGESPQKATWYALVPRGENPDVRVGHTLTYVPDTSEKGTVIIVGGANPNGSFSDAHILNLETGVWRSPAVNGTPPTPRTCHGSAAAIGDCLYVFGGGDKGAEPVQDIQLHVFDKATLSWSQQSTEGKPPAPRHGHVMVAVGSKLFIHGGLAGKFFFNDMYFIDTANMRWKKVKMKGDIPGGCAAHSAFSHGKYIFIFGGMDATGALNTMYKYHVETNCWTLLEFDSSLPPGRLDHAMCVIPWKIREYETSSPASNNGLSAKGNTKESNKQSGNDGNFTQRNCSVVQNQTKNIVNLCLIFGGMDTQGEVYNDCFVTLINGY